MSKKENKIPYQEIMNDKQQQNEMKKKICFVIKENKNDTSRDRK